jgi:hypothetical protein
LEGISRQVSELAGRIDSLMTTYSGLAEKLATHQKGFLESVKAKAQSNKPAWIAAGAAITAALIAAAGSAFTGWNTAQTNAKLTRFMTLQSENAKRGLDVYYEAQGKIANLEQGFETFLLGKKLTPQIAQLGNDLNGMCIANRFEPKTAIIKDYNDFISRRYLGFNITQRDGKTLKLYARKLRTKAVKALQDLEQGT